jgi:hypothetical protein
MIFFNRHWRQDAWVNEQVHDSYNQKDRICSDIPVFLVFVLKIFPLLLK